MRFVKDLVALVVTIAFVMTTTPASADTVAVPDPRGDAPRAIDVTRMRVDNGPHAVRIHLRFADLNRSRVRSVRSELDVGRRLGWGYQIAFTRRASGGFAQHLRWVRLYAEGGTTLPPCAGLRLTWGEDRADIRLPRSCMSGRHDERVRANSMLTSLPRLRDRVPDNLLAFSPWVSRG